MDQGYVRQLIKGHRIEVNGEATYAAAARRTADAEQRAKWCTLEWLESQTKRELAASPRMSRRNAISRGANFAATPGRSSRFEPCSGP